MVGITALALSLLLAFGLVPSDARAASDTDRQKVAVFEDAVIAAGDEYDTVVVVGGDLLVQGTVRTVVVVVGGDVTLASTSEVGAGQSSSDTVLVSVFGDVTIEPGARVLGETVDVAGGFVDVSSSTVSDPFFRPWRPGAILSWVWSTILLAALAAIVAAIAPRQVVAVSDRVGRHFFSSLGLGALGAIIAVPIITVVMIVTIIGILLVVPWLFVGLPLLALFGFVSVGAALGRVFFRGTAPTRGTVMMASLVGVVIINLARWIPVGGLIILGLLWLVGFGAAYVAIYVWLRDRRRRRKHEAQMRRVGPGGPVGPSGPTGPGGPIGPAGPGGPGTPMSAGGPVATSAPQASSGSPGAPAPIVPHPGASKPAPPPPTSTGPVAGPPSHT